MRVMKGYQLKETSATVSAIQKFGDLLAKKIGKKVRVCPVAIDYQNSYGKFTGYYAIIGAGECSVRVNFPMGSTSKAYSVDYIPNNVTLHPAYTVMLDNLSPFAILTTVAQLTKGEYNFAANTPPSVKEGTLRESAKIDFLRTWMDSNKPAVSTKTTQELYRSYLGATGLPPAPVNEANFIWYIKEFLRMGGIVNPNVPLGRVVAGANMRQLVVNSSAEQVFQNEITLNDLMVKYELLQGYVSQVAKNNKRIKALFIYGTPGVGKSFNVADTLKTQGAQGVVLKKGNIAGSTGLLQLLYDNKDEKILVLDDNDAVLANDAAANLLKAALDSDEPRWVTYTKKTPGSQRNSAITIKGSKLSETPQVFDMDDDAGVEITQSMYEFQFNSRIIFISNLSKVPAAVGDRCIAIEMNFTLAQILDIIESKLAVLEPDIEMSIKKEVLDYIRTIVFQFKGLTFRTFKHCLVAYDANVELGEAKWKNAVKALLASAANLG